MAPIQKPAPGFWQARMARPSLCEAAKRADARTRRLREHTTAHSYERLVQ